MAIVDTKCLLKVNVEVGNQLDWWISFDCLGFVITCYL